MRQLHTSISLATPKTFVMLLAPQFYVAINVSIVYCACSTVFSRCPRLEMDNLFTRKQQYLWYDVFPLKADNQKFQIFIIGQQYRIESVGMAASDRVLEQRH